jgi:hypothetical protein
MTEKYGKTKPKFLKILRTIFTLSVKHLQVAQSLLLFCYGPIIVFFKIVLYTFYIKQGGELHDLGDL